MHPLTSITFLLLALSLVSCQDLGEGTDDGSGWAIDRLADTTLTVFDVRSVPLEKLALQAHPFIREADLTAYYWSSHSFTGTARLDSVLHSLAHPGGKSRGIPFVVTVGRKPVYLATFWYPYSSIADPGCPYLMVPWSTPQLYVIHPSDLQAPDPRGDPRVFAALNRAWILRL